MSNATSVFDAAFSAPSGTPPSAQEGGTPTSPAKQEPTQQKPEPQKPEPQKPEPAKSEPAKGSVSKPEPAKPEPPKAGTAKPEPAKTEPAKPDPTAKKDPVEEVLEEISAPKKKDHLREAYESTKAKLAERETALQTREKEYNEKIEALRNQVEETELKLRFTDYSQSSEFQTQFQVPINSAWDSAIRDLDGYEIQDGDVARKVTENDISDLVAIPTAAVAAKKAKEMFGDAAGIVLSHRQKIRELGLAKAKAVEDWKTKGSERSRMMAEDHQIREQQARASLESEMELLREAQKEIYGEDENPEMNAHVQKGNALVRLALYGEGLPGGMPDDQKMGIKIAALGRIAVKASSFDREHARSEAKDKRIAELEAELKKLNNGDPDQKSGTRSKPTARNWREEVDQAFDSIGAR
jgi:hypothetical protein